MADNGPVTTAGVIAVGNLQARIDGQLSRATRGQLTVGERAELVELLALRGHVLGCVADAERAAALADDLIGQVPGDARSFAARARTRGVFHRFGPALTDLDTAAALGGDRAALDAERAAIYQALGRFDEALAIRQRAVDRHADFSALAALAGVHGERGEMDEAERWFSAATRSYRGTSPFPVAMLEFQHGQLWMGHGNLRRARAWCDAAVRRLPAYVPAQGHLARRLREAHAACEESAATGVPIDEVADIRAGRRVCQRRTACEVVETYNDAAQRVLERGAPEDHLAKWVAMENVKRVGRREFLTGAAKAGAGIAASVLVGGTVLRPQRAVAGTKQPTIAIVGAGLAGLRCAHMLCAQKGWTSTIYEATSDIGGRCETQRSYWKNGLIAEMHGEFISSEHSSVLGLASLFNLSLDNTRAYPSGTVDTYWVNGARYTRAQLDADWQSWAWSLFQSAIKQAPWPQSYNSYNATGYAWDHMSVPEWINRYMPGGTAGNFGAVCLQNVIDEYGGDPSDQSSLNLTMILGYYDSKGPWVQGQDPPFPYLAGTDELYHITGGNDQIVNGLVNQLPAGTIKTGEALVALAANSNGTYALTFQNGSKTKQVTVDSVVLALPFKTLQNVDLSKAGFSPLKMTAINTMGMGTDAKIIMQFNGEPWSTNGYTGTTYQDLGFISSGWQMVQSAAAGGYTGPTGLWTAYPGGNYTPSIISKYNLTNSSGTPPPKMVSDTLGYLEPVLPGVTAAYNGLAWYDFGLLDPYLQGAYSYWRVGQYTGFSGYEGAQEGHVHFAGEHTTQDFQGYMEGATLSGERCAKEIGTGGG